MRSTLPLSSRQQTWLSVALLAIFVLLGFYRFADSSADDLSASYIGCRLIASGASNHLYAHDPQDFSAIGFDDEWQSAADDGHFEGSLHPYVQTPLWARALRPLCTRMDYLAFVKVFTLLVFLSFTTLIFLVARAWTPRLLNPVFIALLLPFLWFSAPFQYAMFLMQTHIFFVLSTVAAIILTQRGRPIPGGILLAFAAAIKITPAVFVLYWLLTRRWKAAASFVIASAVLLVAAVVATGRPLFAEYLATLHRISHTLLVSQNNQSLAAWWMQRFYPASETLLFHIHPLPAPLSILSSTLILLCAVAAGLLDRRAPADTSPHIAQDAPLGALLLLVSTTLLTPIAWTHYYIVLLPAVMVLIDIARRRRSLPLALSIGIILTLNVSRVIRLAGDTGTHLFERAQFFSGVLCVVTLAVVALTARRYTTTRPTLT